MDIFIAVFIIVILLVIPVVVAPIASGINIADDKNVVPFTPQIFVGAILASMDSNESYISAIVTIFTVLVIVNGLFLKRSVWSGIGIPICTVASMLYVLGGVQEFLKGNVAGVYISISIISISALLEFGAYTIYRFRHPTIPEIAVNS